MVQGYQSNYGIHGYSNKGVDQYIPSNCNTWMQGKLYILRHPWMSWDCTWQHWTLSWQHWTCLFYCFNFTLRFVRMQLLSNRISSPHTLNNYMYTALYSKGVKNVYRENIQIYNTYTKQQLRQTDTEIIAS